MVGFFLKVLEGSSGNGSILFGKKRAKESYKKSTKKSSNH